MTRARDRTRASSSGVSGCRACGGEAGCGVTCDMTPLYLPGKERTDICLLCEANDMRCENAVRDFRRRGRGPRPGVRADTLGTRADQGGGRAREARRGRG